jgi:hypothetical protein
MANYARTYQRLAKRAAQRGRIDLEAFIEQARDAKMSDADIERAILGDLINDGPVFGAFFRSLSGAGVKSTSAAYTSARDVGSFLDDPEIEKELKSLEALRNVDDIEEFLSSGDPDELEAFSDALDPELQSYVSVADFVNTCYICLPLHGHEMTKGEWQEQGLWPDQRHPEDWLSDCKCTMMPIGKQYDQTKFIAPLRRVAVKDENGKRIGKRTIRAVTQNDIDKARKAAEEARQNPEGRKVLRALGTSNG